MIEVDVNKTMVLPFLRENGNIMPEKSAEMKIMSSLYLADKL